MKSEPLKEKRLSIRCDNALCTADGSYFKVEDVASAMQGYKDERYRTGLLTKLCSICSRSKGEYSIENGRQGWCSKCVLDYWFADVAKK